MVAEEGEGRLQIARTLLESNIEVDHIERIIPSLEDVFLYLLDRDPGGKKEAA
jgi:hypothetical protein